MHAKRYDANIEAKCVGMCFCVCVCLHVCMSVFWSVSECVWARKRWSKRVRVHRDEIKEVENEGGSDSWALTEA